MSQALQMSALSSGNSASATTYSNNYNYYTNIAAAIRTAYFNNLAMLNPDGTIADFYDTYLAWYSKSQGDCLSALSFSMVPDSKRANLITNLWINSTYGISNYNNACTGTSKCDHHLSTGYGFTTRGMLESTRNGLTTNAYQLLTTPGFPSWVYEVTNGFTTCWEGWNTYLSANVGNGGGYNANTSLGSFNHLSFGAVGEWIWKVIGGINPDDNSPGFKNVIIKPEPGGGITNAFASFNSIHGPIASTWSTAGTTYTLNVINPANITASIYIPTTNLANITENALVSGTFATNAPGVISYYTTNYSNFKYGATIFQIGSGTYSFKATGVSF
jgi:alpha-L-rhamnosidase